MAFSRTRIGAMNDNIRRQLYLKVLSEYITSESVCLCLSDGTLYGLAAARLGAKVVYCIENNLLARRVLESFISYNKLDKNVVVLEKKLEEMDDSHLLGKVRFIVISFLIFLYSASL